MGYYMPVNNKGIMKNHNMKYQMQPNTQFCLGANIIHMKCDRHYIRKYQFLFSFIQTVNYILVAEV